MSASAQAPAAAAQPAADAAAAAAAASAASIAAAAVPVPAAAPPSSESAPSKRAVLLVYDDQNELLLKLEENDSRLLARPWALMHANPQLLKPLLAPKQTGAKAGQYIINETSYQMLVWIDRILQHCQKPSAQREVLFVLLSYTEFFDVVVHAAKGKPLHAPAILCNKLQQAQPLEFHSSSSSLPAPQGHVVHCSKWREVAALAAQVQFVSVARPTALYRIDDADPHVMQHTVSRLCLALKRSARHPPPVQFPPPRWKQLCADKPAMYEALHPQPTPVPGDASDLAESPMLATHWLDAAHMQPSERAECLQQQAKALVDEWVDKGVAPQRLFVKGGMSMGAMCAQEVKLAEDKSGYPSLDMVIAMFVDQRHQSAIGLQTYAEGFRHNEFRAWTLRDTATRSFKVQYWIHTSLDDNDKTTFQSWTASDDQGAAIVRMVEDKVLKSQLVRDMFDAGLPGLRIDCGFNHALQQPFFSEMGSPPDAAFATSSNYHDTPWSISMLSADALWEDAMHGVAQLKQLTPPPSEKVTILDSFSPPPTALPAKPLVQGSEASHDQPITGEEGKDAEQQAAPTAPANSDGVVQPTAPAASTDGAGDDSMMLSAGAVDPAVAPPAADAQQEQAATKLPEAADNKPAVGTSTSSSGDSGTGSTGASADSSTVTPPGTTAAGAAGAGSSGSAGEGSIPPDGSGNSGSPSPPAISVPEASPPSASVAQLEKQRLEQLVAHVCRLSDGSVRASAPDEYEHLFKHMLASEYGPVASAMTLLWLHDERYAEKRCTASDLALYCRLPPVLPVFTCAMIDAESSMLAHSLLLSILLACTDSAKLPEEIQQGIAVLLSEPRNPLTGANASNQVRVQNLMKEFGDWLIEQNEALSDGHPAQLDAACVKLFLGSWEQSKDVRAADELMPAVVPFLEEVLGVAVCVLHYDRHDSHDWAWERSAIRGVVAPAKHTVGSKEKYIGSEVHYEAKGAAKPRLLLLQYKEAADAPPRYQPVWLAAAELQYSPLAPAFPMTASQWIPLTPFTDNSWWCVPYLSGLFNTTMRCNPGQAGRCAREGAGGEVIEGHLYIPKKATPAMRTKPDHPIAHTIHVGDVVAFSTVNPDDPTTRLLHQGIVLFLLVSVTKRYSREVYQRLARTNTGDDPVLCDAITKGIEQCMREGSNMGPTMLVQPLRSTGLNQELSGDICYQGTEACDDDPLQLVGAHQVLRVFSRAETGQLGMPPPYLPPGVPPLVAPLRHRYNAKSEPAVVPHAPASTVARMVLESPAVKKKVVAALMGFSTEIRSDLEMPQDVPPEQEMGAFVAALRAQASESCATYVDDILTLRSYMNPVHTLAAYRPLAFIGVSTSTGRAAAPIDGDSSDSDEPPKRSAAGKAAGPRTPTRRSKQSRPTSNPPKFVPRAKTLSSHASPARARIGKLAKLPSQQTTQKESRDPDLSMDLWGKAWTLFRILSDEHAPEPQAPLAAWVVYEYVCDQDRSQIAQPQHYHEQKLHGWREELFKHLVEDDKALYHLLMWAAARDASAADVVEFLTKEWPDGATWRDAFPGGGEREGRVLWHNMSRGSEGDEEHPTPRPPAGQASLWQGLTTGVLHQGKPFPKIKLTKPHAIDQAKRTAVRKAFSNIPKRPAAVLRLMKPSRKHQSSKEGESGKDEEGDSESEEEGEEEAQAAAKPSASAAAAKPAASLKTKRQRERSNEPAAAEQPASKKARTKQSAKKAAPAAAAAAAAAAAKVAPAAVAHAKAKTSRHTRNSEEAALDAESTPTRPSKPSRRTRSKPLAHTAVPSLSDSALELTPASSHDDMDIQLPTAAELVKSSTPPVVGTGAAAAPAAAQAAATGGAVQAAPFPQLPSAPLLAVAGSGSTGAARAVQPTRVISPAPPAVGQRSSSPAASVPAVAPGSAAAVVPVPAAVVASIAPAAVAPPALQQEDHMTGFGNMLREQAQMNRETLLTFAHVMKEVITQQRQQPYQQQQQQQQQQLQLLPGPAEAHAHASHAASSTPRSGGAAVSVPDDKSVVDLETPHARAAPGSGTGGLVAYSGAAGPGHYSSGGPGHYGGGGGGMGQQGHYGGAGMLTPYSGMAPGMQYYNEPSPAYGVPTGGYGYGAPFHRGAAPGAYGPAHAYGAAAAAPAAPANVFIINDPQAAGHVLQRAGLAGPSLHAAPQQLLQPPPMAWGPAQPLARAPPRALGPADFSYAAPAYPGAPHYFSHPQQ